MEVFDKYRQKALDKLRLNNFNNFIDKVINDKIDKTTKIKIEKRFEKYKTILLNNSINNIDEYIDKIKKNPLLALGIEKEPIRQSFDEKIQIEYQLKKNNINIEKLPNNKSNARCFDIRNEDKVSIISPVGFSFKSGERTKTFDGYIEKSNTFVFMKYINESGGSQDNQINDLKILIKYADLYLKQNKNTEYNFIILIDGNYIIKNIDSLKIDNKKIIIKTSND